jgi:hypothetical protein
LVEASGVDASQQGVHEALDEFAAKTRLEDRGGAPLGTLAIREDGPVLIGATRHGKPKARGRDRRPQGEKVEGGSGEASPAHDSRPGESDKVRRQAEDEPCRQRAQTSPRHDGREACRWCQEIVAKS